MKRLILPILLLLGCLWTVALQAATEAQFPRYRTIWFSTPERNSKLPAALRLDADFFELTGSLLADLRVFDLNHREVPFLVRRIETTRGVTQYLPLGTATGQTEHRNDGAAVYTLTPTRLGLSPCRLEIQTNSRNFDRLVQVEGLVNDTWRPLGEPQSVFDCSDNVEIRRTVIDFPPMTPAPARLRLTVYPPQPAEKTSPLAEILRNPNVPGENPRLAEVREGEINIEELRFFAAEKRPVKGMLSTPFAPELTRVEELEGTTILGFEARRRPLERLTLESDTPYFIRHARLFGGPGPNKLRLLQENSLIRLQSGETPVIDFGNELRESYYELHILNQERAPLTKPVITAYERGYELLLPAPATSTLRLYFGAAAASPEYDVAKLIGYQGKTVSGTLGERTNNPDFRPLTHGADSRWVLIALAWLFIAAALLVALRIFLPPLRRAKRGEAPDAPPAQE